MWELITQGVQEGTRTVSTTSIPQGLANKIEAKKKHAREYTRELYKKRREIGVCLFCGGTPRKDATTCRECLDKQKTSEKDRIRGYKKKAVDYLGGICSDCGLVTEYVSVYDFHHTVPSEKTMTVTRMIGDAYSWKSIQKELDKCVLLCSNCHRVRHEKGELV